MAQRINWTVESLGEKHRRGRMFIYLNSGLNVPPEVQVSENIQSIKRYRRKVRGWSIIFFFSKHLSNTSYEPGTVLDSRNKKRTDIITELQKFLSSERDRKFLSCLQHLVIKSIGHIINIIHYKPKKRYPQHR